MCCVVLVFCVFCLSLSRVLCAQCCQCLWIACRRPVSCVPNVVSVYGLFFFVLCLVYPILPVSMDCMSSSCVLCTQWCQCLWIVFLRLVYPMLSVSMDCLSSSCVLCAQCCQCLSIVHSLTLLPRSFICLVYSVPNIASAPRLFILYCFFLYRLFVSCLVCPMLPVPLDCPFSIAFSSIVYLSRVLCAQCCQCL